MAKQFCRIICHCPNDRRRRGRSNFLGAVLINTPTTVHHFCPACKTLWEHTINSDGVVERRQIKERFNYTEQIAVVDR